MAEKELKEKAIFKITLLLLSTVLMLAPAISPALPLMYHAFDGINRAGVELLSSVPNFGIVLGLIVSPFLVKYLGEKFTISFGLVITSVAGSLPVFISNYSLILISRLFLGIGLGSFNSLAVSLIPQFYHENKDEMATLVGWQNIMGNLGAALMAFLMSYLLQFSWHAAFCIYLLALPIWLLFIVVVKFSSTETKKSARRVNLKEIVNFKVAFIALIMFMFFLFWMVQAYKIPAILVEKGIGTVNEASTLTGILNIIAIPSGALFGSTFKKINTFVAPLGYGMMALGMLIIAFGINFTLLFIGAIILGLGFGFGFSYLFFWLDGVTNKDTVNIATTICLIALNIGGAVSPIVINLINKSSSIAMIIAGTFFSILTVLTLLKAIKHSKAKL